MTDPTYIGRRMYPTRSLTPLQVSRDIVAAFAKLPRVGTPSCSVVLRRPRPVTAVDPDGEGGPPRAASSLRAGQPMRRSGGADGGAESSIAQRFIVSDDAAEHGPAPSPLLLDHSRTSAVGSSAPSSDLKEQVERYIDRELKVLHRHGTCSPEERLMVFQLAARSVLACFPTCESIMQRVLREYDAYVESAHSHVRKVREQEAAASTRREALEADLAAAKAEIQRLNDADAERRQRVERRCATTSQLVLAEIVDSLDTKLASERKVRQETEARLRQTATLTTTFDEAMRAMESNYETILAEKDEQIAQLTLQDAESRRAASAARDRANDAVAAAADEVAAGDIEIAALRTKCVVLEERVRSLEGRHVVAVAKHTELSEAYGVLEARLERANKPTSAAVTHDPTLTPRPSKRDIAERVPHLGSVHHYSSTNALIEALIEAHAEATRRATEAERMAHASKATVQSAIAAYKLQLRARSGSESRPVATSTD